MVSGTVILRIPWEGVTDFREKLVAGEFKARLSRGGVLVDPIFLFVDYAVATGNLAGGSGLMAGVGKR